MNTHILSHLTGPVGLGTYFTKLMYIEKSDRTRRFLNSFMISECLCFFSLSTSLSSRSRTLPSSSSLSVVPHSLQHQCQQWKRWGSSCNEAIFHETVYCVWLEAVTISKSSCPHSVVRHVILVDRCDNKIGLQTCTKWWLSMEKLSLLWGRVGSLKKI